MLVPRSANSRRPRAWVPPGRAHPPIARSHGTQPPECAVAAHICLREATGVATGSMASSYSGCAETRMELHARTEHLFNRVWEADAASDATIDLDDAEPHIVIEGEFAAMYYGNTRMYTLALVSALRTDDRMYTCRGDIFPNNDVAKLYREVARVIDDALLCFPGTYGCSVAYTGLLEAQCYADDVVPYYYTASSPLRGKVDFDMLLPADEAVQRRVFVINVANDAPLLADADIIPDGSIVYLAGRHHKSVHARFIKRFAGCCDAVLPCAHRRGSLTKPPPRAESSALYVALRSLARHTYRRAAFLIRRTM